MNIYYTNGFNTDKKIGQAHNDFAHIVPYDNDYIVFQDQDVCFLNHFTGKLIHDAVTQFGHQFDIFGVMTNRIGLDHQRYPGMENEADISKHYMLANNLAIQPLSVKPCAVVAGMVMIMKRSTWSDLGGFTPGIHFDSEFCLAAALNGYTMGVIENIYVLHLYRWGKGNPAYNYHHLL